MGETWHVNCVWLTDMTELFSDIDVLRKSMDFHMRRHNVLGSNVANLDTPGFQPVDLVRDGEGDFPQTLALTATKEGHVGQFGLGESETRVVALPERVSNPGYDGNSVSLERELSKIAVNTIRYQGAARIVAKRLAMIRYATNDGRGA